MVEGSPADSVKLAICELMPRPPDLIVSGINAGVERGDQRALLGHGGRGDRGGVLQDHQHRRLARAGRALRLPPRRQARRAGHRADPGQQAGRPARCSTSTCPRTRGASPRASASCRWASAATARASSAGRTPAGRTYYWMTYSPPYPPRRPRDRRHQPLRGLHHRHPAPLRPDPPRPDRRGRPAGTGTS